MQNPLKSSLEPLLGPQEKVKTVYDSWPSAMADTDGSCTDCREHHDLCALSGIVLDECTHDDYVYKGAFGASLKKALGNYPRMHTAPATLLAEVAASIYAM
eukprot:6440750-Karenia_brevis.AAC.1